MVATLLAALVGWVLCAATMGLGMAFLPQGTALIVHAVAAPIYFSGISWFYFSRYHHYSPLITGLIFTGSVMALDFFVVALLVLKSMDMFFSLLGTRIPFLSIFLSTWITGSIVTWRRSEPTLAHSSQQ